MKKVYILFTIIFMFIAIFAISNNSYAADLDEIVNYEITVDPRMTDGSLDITYDITWKVLDSTTEGPLSWVQIGTPNSNFDNIVARTNNIKSITKYNGSYVKIVFNRSYKAGEQIRFKYSIHQSYMYKISGSKCTYKFTPAWFTEAKVDNIKIKWNASDVKSSDSKEKEDNYLVWKDTNLSKGSKKTINVKYDKDAFSALSEYKQSKYGSSSSSTFFSLIFVLIIILFIISIFTSFFGGGGYYRHRGFYGGGYYGGYYRSCVRSSCACACAHSCACACAGSGRAGCSKKDFYGTNLTTKKIKKAMRKIKE